MKSVAPENGVDLTQFKTSHSLVSRFERILWNAVWLLFYRPSPRPFHFWRRWLLRAFGAEIGRGAKPHPRVRFWLPRNLTMGDFSILGDDVDCYCVDRITLGKHAVVSQYAYLCTATHDIRDPYFPLLTSPIQIGDQAWVAAGAFIAPGRRVGIGSVVGARACVVKDVADWTIVGGNPAAVIGHRTLQGAPSVEEGEYSTSSPVGVAYSTPA